ncbi:hypothetical protein Bbelb_200950, partial [Branchiostoma belcheri]
SGTCGQSSFRHFPQTGCGGSAVDITSYTGVSLQFCAEACCALPTCLSFQYSIRAACYLKNKLCSASEKVSNANGNMYDRLVLPVTRRGHQVYIVNEQTGAVVEKAVFDTHHGGGGVTAAQQLTTYLQGIAEGRVVAVLVYDSGNTNADNSPDLRAYGSTTTRLAVRESWAMISQQGAIPSWFVEGTNARGAGPTIVQAYIPTDSSTPTPTPIPDPVSSLRYCWSSEYGMSAVAGLIAGGERSSDPPNYWYLGDFSDTQGYGECARACDAEPLCVAFSFHYSAYGNSWGSQCYGRGTLPDTLAPSVNIVSGVKLGVSCGNDTCVQELDQCDGWADCPDGRDELSAVCDVQETATVQSTPTRQLVCERQTMSIECAAGTQIAIMWAVYGRIKQDASPCASNSNTNCRASTSFTVMTAECGGKSSCTIQAENSVFGDPCSGTEKYLDVVYECRQQGQGLQCPNGYAYHQPSRLCYKAFNDAATYNGAVSRCSSDGGTLAMPRDTATNEFLIYLKNAVDINAWFRFGLTDDDQEGVWMWDDNVPLGDFSAWAPREPSGSGSENCAEYFPESWSQKSAWNDGQCTDSSRKFICQVSASDPAAAVGIWPLNRQHGANDTSGNGYHATAEGVRLSPGLNGEPSGSYSLSRSHVSFLRISSEVFRTAQSFTVLFNIYPTGEGGTLLSFSDGQNTNLQQANSTTVIFNILTQTSSGAPVILTLEASVLTLNTWNYLGVSYNYTTGVAMIWHEGIPVAKSNFGRLALSAQGDLIVGNLNTSSAFGGRVSCLQVYGAALSKAEVEKARDTCYGGNVAVGKTANQSSSLVLPNRDTSAGQAVDGYLGTTVDPGNACTLTALDTEPWWLVNLGNVTSVGTVRILNRGDCCGERLQNFQVRVGDSPNFQQNPSCGVIYTGTPSSGERIELHCREGTVGQYVSVQTIKTTEHLSLCEVEVFPETDVSPSLACGETTLFVTERKNGTLSSPNFGSGTYPPNSACRWLLTAPDNGIIVLNIVVMDFQGNVGCTSDSVVVYDGPTSSFPVLGRFCGTTESVVMSGSQMFVEFVSDGETESFGFMATFTAISLDENIALGKSASHIADLSVDHVPEKAVDGDLTTCSSTTNQHEPWWKLDMGAAYSVTKVRLYTNANDSNIGEMNNFNVRIGDNTDMSQNAVCGHVWTDGPLNENAIEISCGDAILGRYVSVQIEGRADYLRLCEVEVFLGREEASPAYECSETSVYIVSGDSGLLLKSGNLTDQNSDGVSPVYSVNQNCSWLISAQNGGLLSLTFTTFDLPDSAACTDGYLAVYDGANSQAPSLGRFCGSALSSPVISSGTMYVQFVTYGHHMSTFSATFAAGKSRNLALMKSAEQSSTSVRGGASLSAGLAVDGNTETGARAACAGTDVTDQPWWRVDLGGVYLVQKVRLFGSLDETLQDVRVRVGTSLDVQENTICGSAFSDVQDNGNILELDCGLAIVGRYVSVQLQAAARSLHLCEVQVFPPPAKFYLYKSAHTPV